jgi:hypothetical protein
MQTIRRDQWLYRDVEGATRRIVVRARCVDSAGQAWSSDVYVLAHDPAHGDEGVACDELHYQHLMNTFARADEAHQRGVEVGLRWIAANKP